MQQCSFTPIFSMTSGTNSPTVDLAGSGVACLDLMPSHAIHLIPTAGNPSIRPPFKDRSRPEECFRQNQMGCEQLITLRGKAVRM